MKNVIDMTRRLKSKANNSKKNSSKKAKDDAPVIDITVKREEMILSERRKVRRTMLSEFIAAFAVIPQKGLLRVTLFDISADGAAFDVEFDAGHFKVGEEVAMRVYLNHETYFPFVVKIQNLRGMPDDGVFRHGAHFVKGTINDEALHHFVRFLETVSASLQTDQGDIQVSNLMR